MDNSTEKMDRTPPSRTEVWKMFDRIAPRYDLLNRVLSCGQDLLWRSSVAKKVPDHPNQRILDIATGTADQLIAIHSKLPHIRHAVGLDMSIEMLVLGKEKLKKKKLNDTIELIHGNALQLPFSDHTMDAITITFGIRNLLDINLALKEMYRILKPGGKLIILEFSLPENFLIRKLYLLYFRNILPMIGSIVSGDSYAYRYLNSTVETFPYGQEFCDIMKNTGFSRIDFNLLHFGIATIYSGFTK